MLVKDLLDAMSGFNEREGEKTKTLAELLRIQTTILWNIQVGENEKLEPQKLWKLPWDVKNESDLPEVPEEEKAKIEETHEKLLDNM
jgi:hypothetical protein